MCFTEENVSSFFSKGEREAEVLGPVGQKAALAGWSEASQQRGKHAQFSFLE